MSVLFQLQSVANALFASIDALRKKTYRSRFNVDGVDSRTFASSPPSMTPVYGLQEVSVTCDDQWHDVLRVTTKCGELNFAAIISASAFNRDLFFRITIDGRVICDASITSGYQPWIVSVGGLAEYDIAEERLPFYDSLVIEGKGETFANAAKAYIKYKAYEKLTSASYA
jgi:hypothetical protein